MSFSVLALDLATTTGWAVHRASMDRPFYGSLQLPRNPQVIGPAGLKLWNWLLEKHSAYQFTHIAYEEQHIAMQKKRGPGGIKETVTLDMNVAKKLIGLAAITEMFCEAAEISCWAVPIGTWRKHFLGKGTGMKRAEVKQACLTQCEAFGWPTTDDNAAEACGILDYFLTQLPGENRPWRDATFMGANRK